MEEKTLVIFSSAENLSEIELEKQPVILYKDSNKRIEGIAAIYDGLPEQILSWVIRDTAAKMLVSEGVSFNRVSKEERVIQIEELINKSIDILRNKEDKRCSSFIMKVNEEADQVVAVKHKVLPAILLENKIEESQDNNLI